MDAHTKLKDSVLGWLYDFSWIVISLFALIPFLWWIPILYGFICHICEDVDN